MACLVRPVGDSVAAALAFIQTGGASRSLQELVPPVRLFIQYLVIEVSTRWTGGRPTAVGFVVSAMQVWLRAITALAAFRIGRLIGGNWPGAEWQLSGEPGREVVISYSQPPSSY